MFNVQCKSNLSRAIKSLNDFHQKQLPFATSLALNRTAQAIKKDLRSEMERVFDRPTPFTLNSLQITPSKKDDLVASIWFKEGAKKYLVPQVRGGARQLKRFEQMFRASGYLPPGWFIVPGEGAKRDRYGNMNRGQIVQILSSLALFREVGFAANVTARSKVRNKKPRDYFVVRWKDGRLVPGVWERVGEGKVRPVLIFVEGALYKKRFHFSEAGRKSFDQNYQPIFQQALADAIRTSLNRVLPG